MNKKEKEIFKAFEIDVKNEVDRFYGLLFVADIFILNDLEVSGTDIREIFKKDTIAFAWKAPNKVWNVKLRNKREFRVELRANIEIDFYFKLLEIQKKCQKD